MLLYCRLVVTICLSVCLKVKQDEEQDIHSNSFVLSHKDYSMRFGKIENERTVQELEEQRAEFEAMKDYFSYHMVYY